MLYWRRGRDSNPRYAINVYTLSRRAPSAARPPLRINYLNNIMSIELNLIQQRSALQRAGLTRYFPVARPEGIAFGDVQIGYPDDLLRTSLCSAFQASIADALLFKIIPDDFVSNPRYAINVYTLSRRAPSAARPPLRIYSLCYLIHCFQRQTVWGC